MIRVICLLLVMAAGCFGSETLFLQKRYPLILQGQEPAILSAAFNAAGAVATLSESAEAQLSFEPPAKGEKGLFVGSYPKPLEEREEGLFVNPEGAKTLFSFLGGAPGKRKDLPLQKGFKELFRGKGLVQLTDLSPPLLQAALELVERGAKSTGEAADYTVTLIDPHFSAVSFNFLIVLSKPKELIPFAPLVDPTRPFKTTSPLLNRTIFPNLKWDTITLLQLFSYKGLPTLALSAEPSHLTDTLIHLPLTTLRAPVALFYDNEWIGLDFNSRFPPVYLDQPNHEAWWRLLAPWSALILGLLQGLFIVVIAYRLFLSWAGGRHEAVHNITVKEVEELRESDLPLYTLLVPLYKEKKVLPALIEALKKLDYPAKKLDILMLVEENDGETIKAIEAESLAVNWRLTLIPDTLPKTKSKACNYGLQLAQGEFLAVYDAEDLPERDQLKRALIAHKKIGKECFSVQTTLNYYNYNENPIASLFSLEYCYWFDFLLPGLDYFGLPLPVGSSGNHFNTAYLKKIGGWDPYNTHDDADLGLRAFAHHYKIGFVNSTTFKEANSHYGNWIRQRSRRLKGLMQSALTTWRRPFYWISRLGFTSWLSFQLIVAGTPFMFLTLPLIWILFTLWIFKVGVQYYSFLPASLIYFAWLSLWASNFVGIYLNLIGIYKRRLYALIPLSLLNPFYWLAFHSVAAYKALWQLFFNPSYWEKTTHGLSKYTPKSE